jgi:solute carrier family 35 protein F5
VTDIFNFYDSIVSYHECTADGLFDQVLSDYIWARAVVLTSPTVATVGMSITIPLAIMSDLVFKGIPLTLPSVGGSLFVIGGFVWVTYASEIEEEEKVQRREGSVLYTSLAAVNDDTEPT